LTSEWLHLLLFALHDGRWRAPPGSSLAGVFGRGVGALIKVHVGPFLSPLLGLLRSSPLPAWSSSCWMMDLSRLDFRSGSLFEADVRRRFSAPVCSGSLNSPSAFWLVVSFGRCIFKLDSVSVVHLLQAAFGGFARGFKVLSLADRVFSIHGFFQGCWVLKGN
jgi:hypothetical protein